MGLSMITVTFDQKDLSRWLSALMKVEASARTFGLDEMQRRCAIDYYQLVVKNIFKRHFPRPAYSKRYRSWKYEYGWMGYPSPWRLRGDLVNSLRAFKNPRGGWIGGVPFGATDSGGKSWFGKGRKGPVAGSKKIAMYGSVEEARRPIFKPSAEEYAGAGWKKRGLEAVAEMRKAWR